MPFDDTVGGATANVYGDPTDTLAAVRARWDDLGYDHTGKTDAEVQGALIRGTAWLEGSYLVFWPGTRGDGQGLHWPSSGAAYIDGAAIADDVIPPEVFNAMCEAAYRELVTPNSLTPDYKRSGVRVLTKEKIGPLEDTYAVSELSGDASDKMPRLTSVEHLLRRLVGNIDPTTAAGSSTSGSALGLMVV